MSNILVTGGAGYIGSQTCKTLAALGHQPICYDNLCRGFRENVRWGPFIEGDLFDAERLKKTLIDYKVEAVIHFAAFAYIKESVDNPEIYFENNLYGSLFLLEAMKQAGVKKLIFSSTCATYGEPLTTPIDETHPQNPINPYGLSKLMVEKVLGQMRTQGGLRSCSLRYFNAGGADLDGELGELHDPEPHILPNLIRSCIQDRTAQISGSDYPTPDGTCVRDFIHVCDLAHAHVLTLNALLEGREISEFYNLGTGKGVSLLQLVETVSKVVGKNLEYEFKERRAGDPSQLIASNQKFEKTFHWKPKHSSLLEIVKSAYQWELKKREL